MWTIGLGLIGFILIMTGHAFQTSGPAWLGFLLVICGVIIDLTSQKPIKEDIYDGRSIL